MTAASLPWTLQQLFKASPVCQIDCALQMHIHSCLVPQCAGGAYLNFTSFEPFALLGSADNVYGIPNFRISIQLARLNLPPRTTVR